MPGATDYTIRRFRRPLVAPPGDGVRLDLRTGVVKDRLSGDIPRACRLTCAFAFGLESTIWLPVWQAASYSRDWEGE